MHRILAISASLLLAAAPALAQPARAHLALGDSAVSVRDAAGALGHYRAAIATDSVSAEAFWKASGTAVDLGEFEASAEQRARLYADAERFARRAVVLAPRRAESHFALARALGRTALSLGTRDRVRYAKDVREHALAALAIDSMHPGALHVMGVWNAEVMRLNGVARMIARNFLGGQVFGSANWDDAVRYMERSVAAEPGQITHRLDLAKIYLDLAEGKNAERNRERARAELERALAIRPTAYNDRHYLTEAQRLIGSL